MFILPKQSNSQSGFSMVESLLVIIIIAILSGILAQSLLFDSRQNEKKARDAIRKQDLKEISSLLSRYALEKGFYPPAVNYRNDGWNCNISLSSLNSCDELTSDLAPYTARLPFDPLDKPIAGTNTDCVDSPCYSYITPDKKHTRYCLCGKLETPPDIPKSDFCQSLNTYGNYCLEGNN